MALVEPWLRAVAAKGGRGGPEVGHPRGQGYPRGAGGPRGWGRPRCGSRGVTGVPGGPRAGARGADAGTPRTRSGVRPPRGPGRCLRFHEWSRGGQRACAAPAPRPCRRSVANGRGQEGGVVVTWGRRCSGGDTAPAPRPGVRFIAPCAVPARTAPPLVRHRKVLIIGSRAVGKTLLAHQFVEGKFVECYEPTVKSTYKKMVVVGKDEFQLQLVDTAGQDEYTIPPHSFIIGIHGYILVYSVTSLRSFHMVKTLHNKLYESRGKMRMPVVLMGNKADLALHSREVKTDEGKKLAESWGAIFLESSAKESQVAQGIFMMIIEEIDRVDNSYSRSTGCCLM